MNGIPLETHFSSLIRPAMITDVMTYFSFPASASASACTNSSNASVVNLDGEREDRDCKSR